MRLTKRVRWALDPPQLVLLLLAVLLGTAAAPALAGDQETVLALRAADLESQGRCDDVIALYDANNAEPSDGRLALIAGRCEIRGLDYLGAVSALTAARDRAQTKELRSDAELQLGIAHYHLEDLDAARASFAAARAAGADDPLLDLYDGLLLLQASETRKAALSLERARRADPRSVEPVASYYAFLAWRALEDEQRARAALARVRDADEDGPWIAEADRILGEERPRFTLDPWFGAILGMEYDSNVVLKADGVLVAAPNGAGLISGKDSGRGYWSVEGGLEVFRSEKWSGGLLAGYTGNGHIDSELDAFDTHYPTASGWIDRRLGDRSTARVRYDYGYAWVDNDPYLSGHTITGSFFHHWGDVGTTELSAAGYLYDFKYDEVALAPLPTAPRCTSIDRDGDGVRAGIQHRYSPGWQDLELRAGYRFDVYDSDGCEYRSDAHEWSAGLSTTVVFDIALDAHVSFAYQPYENVSAFVPSGAASTPKREDYAWRTGLSLERPLGRGFSVLGRYDYTNVDSNTHVYDYDRHVVGAYVRFRLQ